MDAQVEEPERKSDVETVDADAPVATERKSDVETVDADAPVATERKSDVETVDAQPDPQRKNTLDSQHKAASDPSPEGVPRPLHEDAEDPDVRRVDYVARPPWHRPYPAWFLAGRVDFGLVIARPRLSLGWGHAHERWLGIEGNPIASLGGVGAYGGARFFLPYVDLRAGARFIRSFQRSFLEPQDEVDSFDFQIREDGRAKYTAVETELTFDIPAGFGAVVGEVAYTAVLGIPDDRYVFEERIHIVLDPPHVWRARLGYGIRFKRRAQIRLIPVVELVGNPARDLVVIRGGFQVNMRLWDKLEVRLTMLPPLKTRDDFGIEAGSFGLGVRYRWAWVFDKRRRRAKRDR